MKLLSAQVMVERGQGRLHLMASVSDFCHLFRERLNRVTRDIPACFDVMLVEQLEQSINTDSRTEYTTRDVSYIGSSAILRVDPATDSIDIDAISNKNFFDHVLRVYRMTEEVVIRMTKVYFCN